MSALRTEFSRARLLPDGSYETRVSSTPLLSSQPIKPGDVTFYSWNSPLPSGIQHAQTISGNSSRGVTVAQHSRDWGYWVLRPVHAVANIG